MSSAIILVGGLGTRLRSVVTNVPKPMAPINGKPFLEHLMYYWISQGVDHFILASGYLSEIITNYFGNSYMGCKIDYSIEDNPLGTGGALFLASKYIRDEEHFVLLNGDTFFKVKLNEILSLAINKNSDWTLSLTKTDDPSRYMGINIDNHGKILSLDNKLVSNIVNGGVYVVRTKSLFDFNHAPGLPISLEYDVLPEAIHKGQRCIGRICNDVFVDIGIPQDYYKAFNLI
jgi:D-glycero-alpha-D-manno-heptose 1-phosphate guanylyltransferase